MRKLKLIVLLPAVLAVVSLHANTAEAGRLDGIWQGNPGGATYWVREVYTGGSIPDVEVYQFHYRSVFFQGNGTLAVRGDKVAVIVESGPIRGRFKGRIVNWNHVVILEVPIPFPASPRTTLHLTR